MMLKSLVPVLCLMAAPAAATDLAKAVDADYPQLEALYRHLHANPELSGQEVNTAKRLATEARAFGYKVTENVGGTGVVAVLENGPGPVVMIRADMDGLPVLEQTGLAFASKAKGTSPGGDTVPVMHACGHDIHMTVWVGVAKRMAETRKSWSGTLVMIGQPAEETTTGALAMLKDGLYTRFPKPDYNLALHDSASLPAGKIGHVAGYALAAVDSVDIKVRGIGGHGAYPHTTRDPVVLAAQIINGLQTLTSRNKNPLDPAVVTVGTIHGGTKRNIISDEVNLGITVRTYKDETRKLILEGIKRMAENTARAYGLPEDRLPVVGYEADSAPATYNTPSLDARIAPAIASAIGSDNLIEVDPVMGAEDFSEFGRTAEKIPSVIFWAGGVDPKTWAATADKNTLPSLHSPYWAPLAEPTIKTGIKAMTAAATVLLKKK